MTEVNLNPTVEGYRGSIGRLVFKKYKGRTIVSRKPVVTSDPTAGQLAQRERFKEAVEFAKLVLSDPALLAYYKPIAEQRDLTVYALAVADFLRKPSVKDVDFSGYHGTGDDAILITTRDDVGVVRVDVSISLAGGTELESGSALETGAGRWSYPSSVAVAAGSQVTVKVNVFDRPGNTAEWTDDVIVELS